MNSRSFLFILLLSSTTALAQSAATTITPDTDSGIHVGSRTIPLGAVNHSTGNVSLSIPLISLPGRNGDGFTLALQYDSKIWSPYLVNDTQTGEDTFVTWQFEKHEWAVGGIGWHLNLPSIVAPNAALDDNGSLVTNGQYLLTLGDGTKHAIVLGFGSGAWDAEDGSAIQITTTDPGSFATAHLKDGTTIVFYTAVNSFGPQTLLPNGPGIYETIRDRNGNVTTVYNNGTITDSAGHSIQLLIGTSEYTGVQYTDTQGHLQTISFNYQTIPFFSSTPSTQYTTPAIPFAMPVQTGNTCGLCLNGHIWVYQPGPPEDSQMLQTLVFPATQDEAAEQYGFEYNGYGELIKATYPPGGYGRYDYGAFTHYVGGIGPVTVEADFREVIEQYVCASTTCDSSQEVKTKWTPSIGNEANFSTTEVAGVGDPAARTTFVQFAGGDQGTPAVETLNQVSDASGTIQRQVTTVTTVTGQGFFLLPASITTWLCNGGTSQTTTTELTYDSAPLHVLTPPQAPLYDQSPQMITEQIDQVSSRKVYDYTTSPACSATATANTGGLLRQDVTNYLSSSSNYGTQSAAHIVNLPQSTKVLDGSGGQASLTTYSYDDYSATSGNPLQSSAVNLVASAGGNYRGNLTSVSRWLNTSSNSLVTNSTFYDTGQVYQQFDPKSGTSATVTATYTPGSFQLSAIQNALPASVYPATHYSLDPSLGLLTNTTDANGVVTTYSYDSMLRLKTAVKASNVPSVKSGITYTVTPALTKIAKDKDAFGDGVLLGSTSYDGLGRASKQTAPGGVVTDTTYDVLGRTASVSNPYFTGGSATTLTSYAYDALGRKQLQCQPDDTTPHAVCDNTTKGNSYLQWVYNGAVTTSTDENGNSWVRTTDALGRLTRVIEPGSLTTTYQYNVLGDLTCVDQWENVAIGQPCTSSRPRSFVYDSLSRLTSATNPETGTIGYAYLNEGGGLCAGDISLPCSKTDARGSKTTYSYDALNRLMAKNYPNDPNKTPATCFLYDANGSSTPANAIGRLTAEWTQNGSCPGNATSFPASGFVTAKIATSYDALGRLLTEQTCVSTNCAQNSYRPQSFTHDLAGNLTGFSDGWGLQSFTQSYDAAGRLQFLTSSWSDLTHPPTLYGVQNYGPIGVLNATMGNHLTVTKAYDSRERITNMTVQGVH